MKFSSTVLACGICVGLFLGHTAAIQGGTAADRCKFPGLAAALVAGNILCQGVVVGNKFLMPSDCGAFIKTANLAMEILITTEKTVWIIKKGTFKSTPENGYSTIDLSELPVKSTKPDDCFTEGEMYNSKDKLKMDTCVVVGFGYSVGSESVVYDVTKVQSAPITKSTSASCCKTVENTGLVKYSTFDQSHHINCLVSTGKTCGVGDLGSPVMCDTDSGKRVTIALTAAPTCDKDDMFLAHDLTKRSEDVKYGDF